MEAWGYCGPLVGGAGSWGLWLQGPRGSRVEVGQLLVEDEF